MVFGNSTLEFAEMQKIVQNKNKKRKIKNNEIWGKECLIWVFWVVTLRTYSHI